MPEQIPAKTETSPNEFDFVASDVKTPRMKRRSLKGKATAPEEIKTDAVESAKAAAEQQPTTATGYQRPTSPYQPSQSVQPATLPAGTLYYSHGQKEQEAPMKTTPLASPSSSAPRPAAAAATQRSTDPATSSPAARTMPTTSTTPTAAAAASRPVQTSNPASSAARPASVSASVRPAASSDYRSNIDRQSREQKSVGSLLNLIVYSLAGVFIFCAFLAAYGGYILHKQINQQSVTVTDLDNKLSTQTQSLASQLKATQEALTQVQTLATRQQDVLARQQDSINKLVISDEDAMKTLNQERSARASEAATRASETAALRARVRSLETKTQSIFRP